MHATAEILPPSVKERPEIRRCQLPDLDRHAGWFMPRFQKAFPHLSQRQAIGFLRSVLYDNEFQFLYQEHAVSLAQAVASHSLDPLPIVWERFVWVQDPTDQAQLEAASFFYDEMQQWARRKGVTVVHVANLTDVPPELIRARAGRVLSVEQKYISVKV